MRFFLNKFSFNLSIYMTEELDDEETRDMMLPRQQHPIFPWSSFFSDKDFQTPRQDFTTAFKYSTVTKKINPDGVRFFALWRRADQNTFSVFFRR